MIAGLKNQPPVYITIGKHCCPVDRTKDIDDQGLVIVDYSQGKIVGVEILAGSYQVAIGGKVLNTE